MKRNSRSTYRVSASQPDTFAILWPRSIYERLDPADVISRQATMLDENGPAAEAQYTISGGCEKLVPHIELSSVIGHARLAIAARLGPLKYLFQTMLQDELVARVARVNTARFRQVVADYD